MSICFVWLATGFGRDVLPHTIGNRAVLYSVGRRDGGREPCRKSFPTENMHRTAPSLLQLGREKNVTTGIIDDDWLAGRGESNDGSASAEMNRARGVLLDWARASAAKCYTFGAGPWIFNG